MDWRLGYCTNVHAGDDLATTRANLVEHALAVKRAVSRDAPMGVGLWLSAKAARQMRGEGSACEFAGWLRDAGLLPFTLNGFPFGDFHRRVVKHDVYRPTWGEPARVDYTLDLIAILDALLPAGCDGSISTLPLQWGSPPPEARLLAQMAANLRRVADHLARLEQDRGRLIYLCLEPEPGCALQRSRDVVRFFQDYLLADGNEEPLRRYLRVCHDICHAAVMFEDQTEALRGYQAAGIGVGKVQVSSAMVLPLDRIDPGQRAVAVRQLRSFVEDRYLHQTAIRRSPGEAEIFFEDLPQALETIEDPSRLAGQWRVHFHVPVYLERFGLLETSQPQICECLQAAMGVPDLCHFEVETYAWNVLPADLQQAKLADGIARELLWVRQHATAL